MRSKTIAYIYYTITLIKVERERLLPRFHFAAEEPSGPPTGQPTAQPSRPQTLPASPTPLTYLHSYGEKGREGQLEQQAAVREDLRHEAELVFFAGGVVDEASAPLCAVQLNGLNCTTTRVNLPTRK